MRRFRRIDASQSRVKKCNPVCIAKQFKSVGGEGVEAVPVMNDCPQIVFARHFDTACITMLESVSSITINEAWIACDDSGPGT